MTRYGANPVINAELKAIDKAIKTVIENPGFNIEKFNKDNNLPFGKNKEDNLVFACEYMCTLSIRDLWSINMKYTPFVIPLKDQFGFNREKKILDDEETENREYLDRISS